MSAEASRQVRRDARRRRAGVAFGAGSARSITFARPPTAVSDGDSPKLEAGSRSFSFLVLFLVLAAGAEAISCRSNRGSREGRKGRASARRWEVGVGRARRPRRAGGIGLKPDSRAKTPRRRETTNQLGLGPDPLRRGVSSEAGARKWIVVPKRGPAKEAKGAKGERSAPSARGDRRWRLSAPSSWPGVPLRCGSRSDMSKSDGG